MARRRHQPLRKGEPFSVRFPLATDQAVAEEARRSGRSKGAVVAEFTEETLRARRFPGIAFRGDAHRRRPFVIGTGLDVWEIIQMLEDFGSVERLVDNSHVNERQARLALAYRDRYPEEIDAAIGENRLPVEEWRERFPFVVTSETKS
jgi:uncharacterized protein (DUF433 family)